jgi:hypothetical protein
MNALLERAQAWLRGDGLPQLLPGLMEPIDADRLAEDMRLAAQGADRGERDLPLATETNFDPVELEIVKRVSDEASLQRGHLISMLRAYRDRLAELTAATEIAQLRLAAASAVTAFNQAKQQARGGLAHLRKRYKEAAAELAEFKLKHNLARPARDPSGRWSTIGFLFPLIMAESALNGTFFAKGSDLGLVGGIMLAIGISLFNVGWCFGLGVGPARYTNVKNWFVSIVAFFGTLAGLCVVVALHLFAAHLRDATMAFGEERAFDVARKAILADPIGLADIQSWYLCGLGLLLGLFAFFKGYRLDDPYPGYGAVYRRAMVAEDAYNDEHHELFDELDTTKDDTLKAFREGIANIPAYAAKAQQIRAARSALLGQFRAYEHQIEQTINRLLSVYRDANRRRRNSNVPPYFNTPWVAPPSSLSGADIMALTTDTADNVITNVEATLEELKRLSEQVLSAYDQLMNAVEHPSDMA